MNDWFEDPQAFLDELAKSRYITPGDPDGSYLLNNRTTYEGPMYKVFSPAELSLWAEWVRWLGKEYQMVALPLGDPASRMEQLLITLASVAANVPAHLARQLTGTVNGNKVTQSVAAWFKAGVTAVGIGSKLITKEALAAGDFQSISKKAEQVIAWIHQAKAAR